MNKSQKNAIRGKRKENWDILDPLVTKTKGAPSKRLRSGIEISLKTSSKRQSRKVLVELKDCDLANREDSFLVDQEHVNLINESQASQILQQSQQEAINNNAIIDHNIRHFPDIALLAQVDSSEIHLGENWY
ncbi:hypothetical protein RND81_04G109700 [Saponaria officinalis]|uniref:Uncharacterized protein n=1 Tax=Saponaria officinalis TaxID=3572 RepID=A0AAW1LIB5_SAPOF